NSQRQLPTDHDYAVPTREYQTDQSSLKPAQAAARSVFGKKQKQRQKQPHRSSEVDTVTPYQANALIEGIRGPLPEDTPHSPIRELLCSGPGFETRRILSSVLGGSERR